MKLISIEAKEILSETLDSIFTFSPAIIIFGIMFMGALGSMYHIPTEDFMVNSTANLARAGEITLRTFYEQGYDRPKVFTALFIFSIIMAFIYPLISMIVKLIRLRIKKVKIINQKGGKN